MKNVLKLFRPHQYIKNLFIFAPLLFSFHFDIEDITLTAISFILFCLLASSIYILNDLVDIQEDRNHPTKKLRPLPSGKVSKKTAQMLLVILSTFSLISSLVISSNLFFVFLLYFLLNVAYSLKLKHITIVDIFCIATGFVPRLYAGSVTTNISLSMWIIIVTFLLALFLALAKRRDDVLLSIKGKHTRKNIDGYNLEFINASMVLMAGVIMVSYIFYTVSPEVTQRLHINKLFLTSFFVILGIMRYMQITFVEENSGSPTKVVLKDRFLQITITLWLLSFFILVYI